MKIKYWVVIWLMFVILLLFCSKKQTVVSTGTPDADFNQAMSLFEAKKYNKAIEMYQNILFNYPGTSYAGDAQYYIANAYFMKKDYRSAIYEFEFFIRSFPGNQYLEQAYYQLAISYFYLTPTVIKDQSFLIKTLEVLDDLQDRFLETKYNKEIVQLKKEVAERWAQKDFMIGELYYKAGEMNSAQVYFNYVIDRYPDTKWSDRSKFFLGQIYEKKDSLEKAIDLYKNLSTFSDTDSETKKLAQMRLRQIGIKQ